MRKKFHKYLALALSAAMSVTMLAGCGNKEEEGNATPTPAPGNTGVTPAAQDPGNANQGDENPGAATSDAAGIEGWTAFENNVTLKIPVYDRGQAGIPDVKDNYWTKWVQTNFGDKYNITVQYIPIGRSVVMQDYALLASRQDLPTILMEYDYDKPATWSEEGYLRTYDLDEFKKVAPTYYNTMVKNNQLVYTEMNGERYFVLAERPYYNTTPNFLTFVRMDWLRQVGYDHIPLNRAEYLDAMQKIMAAGIAEHPGGGVMSSSEGNVQIYGTRDFPMDELEWAMYGDMVVPSLSWGPNRKAIRYENEDYHLGITNPEYYTIDAATAEANFFAGKTYSYGAYMAPTMALLDSFYAQNPDAELAVYTVYGEEEKLKADPGTGDYPLSRADNPFGMCIGFSRFATDDEMKAAWMYLEWMSQPENLHTIQWGVENETYTLDENGFEVAVNDYEGEYKMGYNGNKDYWCVVIESRNVGDMYDNIRLNSPKGYPQDFTDQIIAQYELNIKRAELGYAISDALFAVKIEAVDEYRGDLQMKYAEYHDSLVMCNPDEFDALYDKYSKEYLDMGYQAVLDDRKEAYEAGKTTKLQEKQKK